MKISELAQSVGFQGNGKLKRAEPSISRTIPPVDKSVPLMKTMRTSVDCYVSGQYVQRDGRVIEVMQRYSVFIAYTRETQLEAMQEVRNRISQDFQNKYGQTFNIATIFVPDLIAPPLPTVPEPEQMYGGTSLFKQLSAYERERYEVSTERLKSDLNVHSIRQRYGSKTQDPLRDPDRYGVKKTQRERQTLQREKRKK